MSDQRGQKGWLTAVRRSRLARVALRMMRPPRALVAGGVPAMLALAGPLPVLVSSHAGSAAATPSRVLCQGWRSCDAIGFTSHGYPAHFSTMYWRMYAGSECTNYTAFVESTVFHVARPSYLLGNGGQWAASAIAHGVLVNHVPSVGAVAEWNGGSFGIGPAGHVAVVEQVGPHRSYIVISQQNIGAETNRYDWTLIRRGFPADQWQEWPSNFIHFRLPRQPGAGFYNPRTRTVSLRDVLGAGPANTSYTIGAAGVIPLLGNWLGTGRDAAGFYVKASGIFHLNGSPAAGRAGRNHTFAYGPPGMIPLAGNWTGRRADAIGYYDPKTGTFHLRDSLSAGADSSTFTFGPPGMIPLAGNWTGRRADGIGFYNPATGTFHLRSKLSAGRADYIFRFGPPHMVPLAGNWTGRRADGIGYYDPRTGTFHLRTRLSAGRAGYAFRFGPPHMVPLAGSWFGG